MTVSPEHTFAVTGMLTAEGPLLLRDFSPKTFGAIEAAFKQRQIGRSGQASPDMPPIMVRTEPGEVPESDLVLGRFINPGDTMYTRRPGSYGSSFAPLEVGAWIQGTRLYSAAAVGQPDSGDNDGHKALILESLDIGGDPLEPGYMAGIEVEEGVALNGLYVTRRNLIPIDIDGGQVHLFDPMFYLA